jgi:hypothetical protein
VVLLRLLRLLRLCCPLRLLVLCFRLRLYYPLALFCLLRQWLLLQTRQWLLLGRLVQLNLWGQLLLNQRLWRL